MSESTGQASSEMRVEDVRTRTLVTATEAHPRNMGAEVIELRDGRLFLAFSQWLGGAHDTNDSQVMGMLSADGGESWGETFPVVRPNAEFSSVRMPSMIRRRDGGIIMLVRCRGEWHEARVGMLRCLDEGGADLGEECWSPTQRISPPPPGRHIALNNRLLRLSSGRLLLPLSSPWPWDREDVNGQDIRAWCLLSDDDGDSWRPSESMLAGDDRGWMEPYVVELEDGRLLMLVRTQKGRQYRSLSEDGGNTWSMPAPVAELVSPESPAAVRRDPGTGWLAVVWNHNTPGGHARDRTPLTIGFSSDEGASWGGFVDLETCLEKAYSYPSLSFVGGRVLVTYYEFTATPGGNRLSLKLCTFSVGKRA